MSTAEREAQEQRTDLRERIVEAARDIVSEQGLDALSMRALAVRIDYSPGTIYLHFKDKDELLRSVMQEGFNRLSECMERELERAGESASPMDKYRATGRGYARFAIENTGYFKAMFRVPRVATLDGCPEDVAPMHEDRRDLLTELLRQGQERGQVTLGDPRQAALVGWGLIHGLVSLYVSGHLTDRVGSHEEFMELIEGAMDALRTGWEPR